MSASIVLATINAGYAHTSLALRCLRANLGRWRDAAEIVEFDGRASPEAVAAALVARAPAVLAFGVFIWNAGGAADVLQRFREKCPTARVVLGGPEVSHDELPPPLSALSDCIVAGEGEDILPEVCAALLGGSPVPHLVRAPLPDLARLEGPEPEYTPDDLTHRIVYLESSRGCPHACAYCLSSTAPGVRWRPMEAVERAWEKLLRRGARRLKIVDRTFNADEQRAARLLRRLASALPADGSVQVEMTPEPPGPELYAAMASFRRGALRVEVGVQTLTAAVARGVGRQPAERLGEAVAAMHHTGAVVHADLIVGLPGETPQSFAESFDRLVALGPDELQINLLKRLRGTPLARDPAFHAMRFETTPPYTVIETPSWPAPHLMAMRRFARFWELCYNRGRFRRTLPLLWEGGASPFREFFEFSERLHRRFGRCHGIPRDDLARMLIEHLTGGARLARDVVLCRLAQDYAERGGQFPARRFADITAGAE
ncbi:MAG: B12-binding domain-containing radical SAM protein [Kiritimatiellae bacterium]|nr:B12-binding domain-containing radical SAM protein [Kiritimatiellia bacterium]